MSNNVFNWENAVNHKLDYMTYIRNYKTQGIEEHIDSKRAREILKAAGIETIGDLLETPGTQLDDLLNRRKARQTVHLLRLEAARLYEYYSELYTGDEANKIFRPVTEAWLSRITHNYDYDKVQVIEYVRKRYDVGQLGPGDLFSVLTTSIWSDQFKKHVQQEMTTHTLGKTYSEWLDHLSQVYYLPTEELTCIFQQLFSDLVRAEVVVEAYPGYYGIHKGTILENNWLRIAGATEREYKVFKDRLRGLSAAETAEVYGVSRQYIYCQQAILTAKLRRLHKDGLLFYEDIYSELYLTYDISKALFREITGSDTVYNYMKLKYQKAKRQKRSLTDLIHDPAVPREIKVKVDAEKSKGHIYYNGQYVKKETNEILLNIILPAITDPVTTDQVYDRYLEVLAVYGLDNKGKLKQSPRSIEGRLMTMPEVLFSTGRKLRLYTPAQEGLDYLRGILQDEYSGVPRVYSTLLVTENTPNLLSIMGLLDHNELHNVMRTYQKELGNYKPIRMPHISVGGMTPSEQLKELYKVITPIHKKDIVDKLHRLTGMSKPYLTTEVIKHFSKYLDGDYYKYK